MADRRGLRFGEPGGLMRVASTTLGIFGAAGSVSAWATSGRDESAQGGKLQDTLQLLSTFASDSEPAQPTTWMSP